MLLRFGVSNFRSIKEYQEISMVASAIKDAEADLIDCHDFKLKVLPAAAIYGANAAGKSNFLRALRHMHTVIVNSHQKGKPGKPIPRAHFLLDSSCASTPTTLDCDFIFKGDRYHYGFIFNDERILEEWLFSFSGKMQRKIKKTLFHRKHDEDKEFYFGPDLKGLNKTVSELTRDNSLLLSAAAANNHKQLLEIYQYFESNFEFTHSYRHVSPYELSKYLSDLDTRAKVVEFLQYADTGIVDVEVKRDDESDENAKDFRKGLSELISKFVGESVPELINNEADSVSFLLKHRGVDAENAAINLADESDGTVALLGILGPVFDVLKNGRILILDELNTNLHPLVSRNLISIFNSKNTNQNGAQLIFTTHDTNLLCGGVMRRDQVWFAEKDQFGASHLYPLSDISTRKSDNISSGYLEGRFGAIPFMANWTL